MSGKDWDRDRRCCEEGLGFGAKIVWRLSRKLSCLERRGDASTLKPAGAGEKRYGDGSHAGGGSCFVASERKSPEAMGARKVRLTHEAIIYTFGLRRFVSYILPPLQTQPLSFLHSCSGVAELSTKPTHLCYRHSTTKTLVERGHDRTILCGKNHCARGVTKGRPDSGTENVGSSADGTAWWNDDERTN